MSYKTWKPLKTRYCSHAGRIVTLEAEVVYPAEIFPNSQPKVLAHRCSQSLICNQSEKANCVWSGTNPVFDPFLDKG